MRRKWKMIFIAPAAILGIALFIFIGGEVVMRLWNGCCRRFSAGIRLLSGKRLGFWPCAASSSVRMDGAVPAAPIPPPHVRTLGTDDTRGAREIPAALAGTVRVRRAGRSEREVRRWSLLQKLRPVSRPG